MKGLYLDDNRTPLTGNERVEWSIVRSYNAFTEWINENGLPEIISFDHDLAWEHIDAILNHAGEAHTDITIHYERFTEKTGYDAAKWLANYCEEKGLDLPMCTVHSANPVGSDNIINFLNNFALRTDRVAIIKRTIW